LISGLLFWATNCTYNFRTIYERVEVVIKSQLYCTRSAQRALVVMWAARLAYRENVFTPAVAFWPVRYAACILRCHGNIGCGSMIYAACRREDVIGSSPTLATLRVGARLQVRN